MSADKRREIAGRLSDEYDIGMDLVPMAEAAMREYSALMLEEAAQAFKEAGALLESTHVTVAEVVRVLLARAAEERKG